VTEERTAEIDVSGGCIRVGICDTRDIKGRVTVTLKSMTDDEEVTLYLAPDEAELVIKALGVALARARELL
jgi:hypothetical protein